MMRKISCGLLAGAALFGAGNLGAQTIAPAPMVTQTPAPAQDNGVLTGTVSDDTAWQSLGIAIPSFATNADVPTAASAGSTAQVGRAIAEVITGDLKNNGLFKPPGRTACPHSDHSGADPDFPTWSTRGAEMLVHGSVSAASNGNLVVGCYLYDVSLKQQLVKATWELPPGDWRRAAHKCADTVYSRLSGESPFFDSRIAYIAETGPKDHRMKRLAIMDSDGANHRFITTGQAMALTPRFSPDYRKIVYLSYLNGRPHLCL
jgi:TolB protein